MANIYSHRERTHRAGDDDIQHFHVQVPKKKFDCFLPICFDLAIYRSFLFYGDSENGAKVTSRVSLTRDPLLSALDYLHNLHQ